MMLYPSINDLRSKTDSKYTLVILAAKRARDITSGVPIFVEDTDVQDTNVSIAAREIANGSITYKNRED